LLSSEGIGFPTQSIYTRAIGCSRSQHWTGRLETAAFLRQRVRV
jgi:hypothetical protein